MNLESLQEQNDQLLLSIADIKHQLAIAKANAVGKGVYADPVWYAKATAALKYKQVEHQQLLTKIANAHRDARREFQNRFERAFLDISRERLD